MEVDRHISPEAVHTGARLLRGTSAVFTGGADGLHHARDSSLDTAESSGGPPTETTPINAAGAGRQPLPAQLIRQPTTSAMQSNQAPDGVQHRLANEAMEMLTRNLKWLVLLLIVFVALMITMVAIFVLALLAVIHNHEKPCDQPLKYYLLASVVWSQIPRIIQEVGVVNEWSLTRRLALTLILVLPGWCIIGWGAFMINSAETCKETNPELFYPTRRLIYFQVGMAGVLLVLILAGALGYRRMMLIITRLSDGPGCAAAVHELPKVEAGAQELVAEDGEVLGCPICIEPLSDKRGAVRTPCAHYFHEECLSAWCESHLDCPLCRQQVGKPEEP